MERTQPTLTDEALQRLIEQPSYGAQVLIFTARMLEMDPTEPMTRRAGGMAMTIAIDTVLATLPRAVQDDSVARATRALPDLTGITRGEAALRLRKAAKELGAPTSRQAAAQPRCPVCHRSFEDCTCTGARPQVRRMLAQMANRLEANRPDQPLTVIGRHALIQATTMDPTLSRALRAKAPEITSLVVRRAYAAQLREIAEGMR